MEEYIACTVKYLRPTNHRGARVCIVSPYGRKIVPYDYAARDLEEQGFRATGSMARASVLMPRGERVLLFKWEQIQELRNLFCTAK